jgi:hypothetical protein
MAQQPDERGRRQRETGPRHGRRGPWNVNRPSRRRPLAEQVVVITGASQGIGRETALLLARRGASVVAAARNAEALGALASEIRGSWWRLLAGLLAVRNVGT